MYKVLRADKDTYINDRVIKSNRVYSSNVGSGGSLDLFKLYGVTSSGSNANVELSRLLIHYDLQPLRDLVTAGKIDPNNPSFNCTLKLFDVYGGQPTPSGFTVVTYPLSRSFEEGLGRDVVYYSDNDVSNFLTGSRSQGAWLLSGCNLGGGLPGSVDYITASTSVASGASLRGSQLFSKGDEDLSIDVTLVVSATIAGLLPDEGFRISFHPTHENDQRTYFVKRFASRSAFNSDKRPKLIVKFDDSIQDDSQSLFFDSTNYIFLYNYVRKQLSNLTSGSSLTQVTGSNSLILKLATEVSGGWYTLHFTGSQHARGIFSVTGMYSASVNLSSTDNVLSAKLAQSGSVKFTPIWGSLDGTVTYLTGSTINAYAAQRGGSAIDNKRYSVSVHDVRDDFFTDEEPSLRVHIFDSTSPLVKASRLPVENPGASIRDVHYQVRDDVSGIVEIPFDTTKNSTRVSSDSEGMFFKLDASSLTSERSYVIDIMIITGNNRQVYKSASPTFRVSDLR